MSDTENNKYVVDETKMAKELNRFVNNRERKFFEFFKDLDEVEKDKKDMEARRTIGDKYLILTNPNTENEKLYNCFDSEEKALKSYKNIKVAEKCIAKGSVAYKMILGVIFVEDYHVEEYIEMNIETIY
ncbi:MAG: hypothetical protein ACRCX8_01865 [Sarcina sp.]